jgi:hypothetical protein
MSLHDLPLEVAERPGPYYVYVLVDPSDESVFYVSKGSKQRLLAHGREADLTADEQPQIEQGWSHPVSSGNRDTSLSWMLSGMVWMSRRRCWSRLRSPMHVTDHADAVEGHGSAQGCQPLSEYVACYGAPLCC